MKTYLLTILSLLISFQLTAHDFSYTYKGNTLTYTVLNQYTNTCGLTLENNSINNKVSGKLIIPEIAIDGDSKYTVAKIGFASLTDCKDMTSVTIPKSVTEIEYNPFSRSFSLTEINVDPDNPNFASHKGALFNKKLTELIAVGSGCEGEYVIPDFTQQINPFAFDDCEKLKSVQIPNSVRSIMWDAFAFCTGLTSLTIPAYVSEIGNNAFWGCSSLTEINVDPYNAFYSSLEGVLYNRSKTELIAVGGGVKGKFVIPDFVRAIKGYSFNSCQYITSITIPGSVKEIGEFAFDGCDSLTDIYVAHDNPNYASFQGALYNKDKSVLIRVGEGKKGELVMPSTAGKIAEWALSSCSKLTSVFTPSSVTEIGRGAFTNCINLKKLYCAAEIPPSCAEDAFPYHVTGFSTLYVPVGAKSVYEDASQWQDFKNIVESDFAGIDAVAASESSVALKVENGRIFVMNKPAESAVKVYTTQGRMIAQTCSDEISGLPSGIYIVTVGARSFKVAI